MIYIDPNKNTERENYKLLIGTVIPRPIAFVTTISNEGTINGAPFSFFNIVSSNPPLISLSVMRKDGEMKDTAKNIIESKEFVVHMVDRTNIEKINQTAATLPPTESEIEKAKLTVTPSRVINVPGIKEAKVRLECQLEQRLTLNENCDLIIGRVVAFHIDDSIYENGKINVNTYQAVSRLAGNSYASIGEIFDIERPR